MSDQQFPDYSNGYGGDAVAESEYTPAPMSLSRPKPVVGELMPAADKLAALTALDDQYQQENFIDRLRNGAQYHRTKRTLIDILSKGLEAEARAGSEARGQIAQERAKSEIAGIRRKFNLDGYTDENEHQIRAAQELTRAIEVLQQDPRMPDWLKERQIKKAVNDFERRYPQA